MKSDACVFAITQIANEFGCVHGELVTRRAGPDIACHSESLCGECRYVHEQLKVVGLAEFEFEDDLTQVPHGVWMKIQYGGLQGLQKMTGLADELAPVKNISAVIEAASQQYQALANVPYQELVPAMRKHKSKRRKAR